MRFQKTYKLGYKHINMIHMVVQITKKYILGSGVDPIMVRVVGSQRFDKTREPVKYNALCFYELGVRGRIGADFVQGHWTMQFVPFCARAHIYGTSIYIFVDRAPIQGQAKASVSKKSNITSKCVGYM
jgi:hypothetical protein